ncbi:MAG: beta-galactosidase [Candidatus Aminicenantes bacterium]|nr:beta-galactosidase [Candidatus Aminicenantes bacterium]
MRICSLPRARTNIIFLYLLLFISFLANTQISSSLKNSSELIRSNNLGQALSENIPRPEYPRPQLYRESWFNLNGYWDFAFDFSDSGEEAGKAQGYGFDRKIIVPFAPESSLSGIGFLDFMPAVWYKRTFTLPESWAKKRILLHFEACDYDTTVWINGEKVGRHEGGYTPFSFDVTPYLKPGENMIIVRARDDVRSRRQPTGKQSHRLESYSCLYRRTTGIWQTVWLEAVPDTFIQQLRFYPQKERGQAALFVYFNHSPEKGQLFVRFHFQGKEVFKVSLPAEKITYVPIKVEKVKLWGIKEPNLYEAEIIYLQGKEEIDRVKSYFGFRSIESRGNLIYLNGKPIFLRFVLDQGFYPDGIYTAPSDEALRRDIELAQAFGFNGARLHQKVFERRFLYWADRLGYLVWGEFPDWGLDLSLGENFLTFQREWREAIERDFNHPALIGWCPFNERWDEIYPGFIEEIYYLTKELDPTRLVIDASGGYHLVQPDVYDAHNYDQNIETFAQAFAGLLENPPKVFVNGDPKRHQPYQGQPYFVSEYGGIWWNPGQQDEKGWGYGARPKSANEFLERYRRLTEVLINNPKIAGFCYTQLYDIEQEVNGLCNFNRQPKFSPSLIRSINEQVAAIERLN